MLLWDSPRAKPPLAWRTWERTSPTQCNGPDYVRIAARQFADPLVALLLAAALVSVVIGEHFEGAVIAAIVVLNALLGFARQPVPSEHCLR